MEGFRSWCVGRLQQLGWLEVSDIVDYLLELSDAEARDYLNALVGEDPQGQTFTKEFFQRLRVAMPGRAARGAGTVDPAATTTPELETDKLFSGGGGDGGGGGGPGIAISGNSTTSAKKKKRRDRRREDHEAAEPRNGHAAGPAAAAVAAAAVPSTPAFNVDASERLMARINEARRQKRVINCLRCGKIHMEVPRSGSCVFCGASLFQNEADVAAEQVAVQMKDLLLNFDQTAAKRTAVIDDDNDYFDASSAAPWLSSDEKQQLQQRQEHEQRRKEQARRQITFTLDLTGRSIAIEDDDDGGGPGAKREEDAHFAAAAAATVRGIQRATDKDRPPGTERQGGETGRFGSAPPSSSSSSSAAAASSSTTARRQPFAAKSAADPRLGPVTPQFVRSATALPGLETGVFLSHSTHRVQREDTD